MKKLALFLFSLGFLLSAAFFFSWRESREGLSAGAAEEAEMVAKAAAVIQNNYVDTAKPDAVFDEALRSMSSHLDGLSGYLSPREKTLFEELPRLGAPPFTLVRRYGFPVIAHLSPNYRGDLQEGDILKRIGDRSTYNRPLLTVKLMLMTLPSEELSLTLIRGEEGDPVRLSLKTDGSPFSLERRGAVSILTPLFLRSSEDQRSLDKALEDLKTPYLLVDLRHLFFCHPLQAIPFLQSLLPREVTLKLRGPKGERLLRLSPKMKRIPKVAALVDSTTGEEAELLAAALKEAGAPLYGETTRGECGLFSSLGFSDGSLLLVLSECPPQVQGKGVTPSPALSLERVLKNPEPFFHEKIQKLPPKKK
ncbi:MAG TPA: hypothetical protein PLB68_02455 [Candidatus Aminicenantes bacterium]|nr:hypothetical protein [Candidatus Aminicenantes bacterium]HPB54796.1 hypothetical protein [Candidatus Aminicenantes bacterium]HPS99087.1 hypothetical protein [Candidatus Aminicenantes bacterium]